MKASRHRWRCALPLCLWVGATSASVAPQAIVLEPIAPADDLLAVWTQSGPVPPRIQAPLGLGEEVGGRVLRLLSAGDRAGRYRVSVQFETSMGISGEGPHIDLLDWKHCRSEWRPAEPVALGGFRLPVPRDRDHTCFPQSTPAELRRAVQQALDGYAFGAERNRQWLDLVEQVPAVGEFPSYVAISTVRVRIEQLDGNRWSLLTTIDFAVPMGC